MQRTSGEGFYAQITATYHPTGETINIDEFSIYIDPSSDVYDIENTIESTINLQSNGDAQPNDLNDYTFKFYADYRVTEECTIDALSTLSYHASDACEAAINCAGSIKGALRLLEGDDYYVLESDARSYVNEYYDSMGESIPDMLRPHIDYDAVMSDLLTDLVTGDSKSGTIYVFNNY